MSEMTKEKDINTMFVMFVLLVCLAGKSNATGATTTMDTVDFQKAGTLKRKDSPSVFVGMF